MLVKLTMKNFRSFLEKTTIDLKSTGYEILSDTNKTQEDILKGALFVGGNASGKTTVILALRFLLELLVWQTDLKLFVYKSLYADVKDRMELEYEFLINGSKIIYKIETDNMRILKETLIQDSKPILSRINKEAEYTDTENKKIMIENIQDNQSVIRKVYFDTRFIDNNSLKSWYDFLINSVYIDQAEKIVISGNTDKDNRNYFENKGIEEVNKFFKQIDYKQKADYVTGYKNANMKFDFHNGKNIILIREDMKTALPIKMESEGNQTLMQVLPQILQATQNNCMLIIDEFSSAFHNVLEEKLVKYFMQNSKESQIFIVSHSTNLLTNTILRPDQIYTVDYIQGKGSKINRVSDSKPREAQNLEKMYLSGVFNGIPNIK